MAQTRQWRARVRLTNNYIQEIVLAAASSFHARAMIEAQYGRGWILFGPIEVLGRPL